MSFFLKEKLFTVGSYKFRLRVKADLIKSFYIFSYFEGGAYSRGALIQFKSIFWGGAYSKGALIQRRALNRGLTVFVCF